MHYIYFYLLYCNYKRQAKHHSLFLTKHYISRINNNFKKIIAANILEYLVCASNYFKYSIFFNNTYVALTRFKLYCKPFAIITSLNPYNLMKWNYYHNLYRNEGK